MLGPERDLRDDPSSSFYCKGNKKERGLGQASPEWEARSLDHSAVLSTPITSLLPVCKLCLIVWQLRGIIFICYFLFIILHEWGGLAHMVRRQLENYHVLDA